MPDAAALSGFIERSSALAARQAYLDGELCGVFPDGITGLKQRFGESLVDLMAYGRTPWS